MGRQRCFWVNDKNQAYVDYHDHEWGVPVFDDQKLFEMLVLEGAQAGLSWETILKRRESYRDQFHQFDIENVSKMTDEDLEKALKNEGIIRNRLKVYSVRKNALAALNIIKEKGSLSTYFWDYVDHTSIVNAPNKPEDYQANTPLSDQISKDLKKRGMSFVGSTIIYAFMQAVGMVNDHTQGCFLSKKS